MEKIKGCISQNPQKIKGCITSLTQSLGAKLGPAALSKYYYTKVEIDQFRLEDREYVDGQIHILNVEIDGVAHKILSVLENKILTTYLLDANDNIISVTSTDFSDIGRKQIYNNSNVDDYEHQVDDIWLCEIN